MDECLFSERKERKEEESSLFADRIAIDSAFSLTELSPLLLVFPSLVTVRARAREEEREESSFPIHRFIIKGF